jgi:hypothetical protein
MSAMRKTRAPQPALSAADFKSHERRILLLQGRGALGEPPRDSRRLHFLRGWSHGYIEEVFPGGPGASGCCAANDYPYPSSGSRGGYRSGQPGGAAPPTPMATIT